MTAPAATSRSTPVGSRLRDGFRTLIAFTADPDVSFWEMTVKPPGVDGGDAVETTTMHNETYRTMGSRELKTMTEASLNVAYDPAVYDQIINLINNETVVTIHFPDTSTLAFYGFLKSFDPSELQEGEQPQAAITIVPTNTDPTTGEEEPPVYTAGAGTSL